MRYVGLQMLIMAFMLCGSGCGPESVSEIPDVPQENEIVMAEGTRITATTNTGTVTVAADKGLKRSYSWEGATRSVIMYPRKGRWFGSMGVYYPGPGNHWKEHNGIMRGVLQEGQQHFDSLDDAMGWLKVRSENCVYRDDGLVVCFSKSPERFQINVDVWQIYVGGKTASKYQETFLDKTGSFKHSDSRLNKVCYVGGIKPERLSGSQNDRIIEERANVKSAN